MMMKRLSFLLLFVVLPFLPWPVAAQHTDTGSPQRPEHLTPAVAWPGKQYLQADAKGRLFLLRPDTLEIYPLVDGELGEPSPLEEIPDFARQMTRETILRAAMSPDGDWLLQHGFDLRLFRGAKEQPVASPKWQISGIGFHRGEPLIAGWPSVLLGDAAFKKTVPSQVAVLARWDGDAWQPLASSGIDDQALVRLGWFSEHFDTYPFGDSSGRIWTASAYRPLLREYSPGGRLLSEVMIGDGSPKKAGNAEELEKLGIEEAKQLSGGGIKATPVPITAQITAESLTEGPDGRLYILIQNKWSDEGAPVALHRFDPVTQSLDRLPLDMPDPGVLGTMAAGSDGLYVADSFGRRGIWRMTWERLEAAAWMPVADVWRGLTPDDLEGAWREKGGRGLVRFAKGRVVTWEDGRLAVRGLVSLEGTEAVLRRSGYGETWKIALQQATLRIERDGSRREYTRLSEIPASVSLDPAPLPPTKELTAERVQAIQSELAERTRRAEAAKKNPDKNQHAAVVADNLRYLREITAQVGWIDAKRFSVTAASQAAELAESALDILLMLAALPHLERDLKPLPESREVFSRFHDTLQVALGGKQLYGTQIAPDVAGEPVLLPLERRPDVDAARRKLGLPALTETLAILSRDLYQGRPVRIAEGEVIEAPRPSVRQAATKSGAASR